MSIAGLLKRMGEHQRVPRERWKSDLESVKVSELPTASR